MNKMLQKLFSTLARKITFAVVLVLGVAGSAFVFFAHTTGTDMLRKQAQAKAHGIAEFGKAILEHIMLEGKNSHLQAALESAISSHQAEEILILKDDGTVLLGMSKNHRQARVDLKQFREVPEWPGERFLSTTEHGSRYEYIISPIVKRPECYRCHPGQETIRGYFAARLSMDDVRKVALEHRTTNILMTILTFAGLGVVIYFALVLLVIQPVEKLRTQIQQVEKEIEWVEQGEEVRLPKLDIPMRQDEVSTLMNAFNKLIERLNEAHRRLHELHLLQLEQADRLATAGEIAASIAHEIKNPLTGVLGALQVLEGEVAEEDPRKKVMREMNHQLVRINQAVNDLLSYARPQPPVFEQVNLNEIIERTLSLVTARGNDQGVVIERKLERSLPGIAADPKLLQQLCWNVVLNAVQAMAEGGILTVVTTHDETHVQMQVQDTGPGIAEEVRAKVFKPFFTTKHKGTGLGLAISKRNVELHIGKIEFESTVARGTTVTVVLPRFREGDRNHEG